MKRTSLKSAFNNIVYVEPNYTYSTEEYGVNGLNTYEFTPPLEDYCLYVNLEVETRGRNVQSSKSANGKKLIMSFTTHVDGGSSINFMQGSKIPVGNNGAHLNSLTTNYTDIFLGDLKKNGPSSELFGIKSIDIAYNNYMVPEVTIEFVDVRGVALFAQKEYYETNKNIDEAIDGGNQTDIANTFFQCFFTFPYPKFTLFIKGFYGQPVSYELTCADFRARFDSSTGNFACTAKFVGYYFSFLNDVMMNGLVSSPYSDYIGSAYWDKQDFKVIGPSGEKTKMPKIGEILATMDKIEKDAERLSQSNPAVQEKNELDQLQDSYTPLSTAYSNYINSILEAVKFEKTMDGVQYVVKAYTSNGKMTSMLVLVPSHDPKDVNNYNGKDFKKYLSDCSINTDNISSAYSNLENAVKTFNDTFPDKNLPMPINFLDAKATQRIFCKPNLERRATMSVPKNDDIKNSHSQLYNKFKTLVNSNNIKTAGYNENSAWTETITAEDVKRNKLLDYPNAFYYDDKQFSNTLEKLITESAERIHEVEKELETSYENEFVKALGWYPSIENITRIVMAHFETFAWMIFSTAESICNEDPSRTIQSLGVNDAYAFNDIKNSSKDINCVVPPFPKVVAKVRHGDSSVMEESWVGDYSGYFREKDLVHGILNGVEEFQKEVAKFENSGSSEGDYETVANAIMKYPLSPIDFFADKKTYAQDGFDKNDLSSLLGLVGLRAVQILSTTNIQNWGEEASILGRAEAVNLLSDITLGKEMLDKLSACPYTDAMQMMYGNQSASIKKPGDGKKPWPWRLDPNGGGIIDTNGTLIICKVKGGAYSIPYQDLSWTKIMHDIVNVAGGRDAIWSNDYLNSFIFKDTDGGFVDKKNVFGLDLNKNRIYKVAESQLKDLNGIDTYCQKIMDESKYDSSKYSKDYLTDNAKNIISYIIENAINIIPTDESCMLPTSSRAFTGKSFKGGYNMNKFHKEFPGEGSNNGWKYSDGKDVKRKGEDGYETYLNDLKTDDIMFTEFPGVDSGLSPLSNVSIFGEYLYYIQDNDNSKALLFLGGLGYVLNYKKVFKDFFADSTKTIDILPLPSVFFAGGLLWASREENKKHIKGYNLEHYTNTNEGNFLNSLKSLRLDVQDRLITIFKKWVDGSLGKEKGFEGLPSFQKIKSGMEITFKSGSDNAYSTFFKQILPNLGAIEDKGWLSQEINGKQGFYGSNNMSDFFKNNFTDNFFKNYIAIDEKIAAYSNEYLVGLRLGNRDGGNSSYPASNFALSSCVFCKNSLYFNNTSKKTFSVNTTQLQNFFEGFLNEIKGHNPDTVEQSNVQISQAAETKTSTDIKVGIYRYCKLIYDKWIAGLSEEDFSNKWTTNKFFETKDKYFHFIDAYYNYAGMYPINIMEFCKRIISCYRSDQYSLLSFLSGIYSQNKCSFLCVQNFLDLGKRENMERMFDTIPYTENWETKDHPNFIVMYNHETSNYLENVEGSEYSNDGFMINEAPSSKNIWPEPLKTFNSNSTVPYSIPAFGVSYGKLYQSYFKDVDVSMDNPTVTEQSIKAQFAIASQSNAGEQTGDRSKMYTWGQDLYSVYSNNSYTCNVTMMGCAWVQPLMYFVLNNIPMFRGTYLIEKVSHHIEPGNMVTKFMGVRMSNVCTRIAQDLCARSSNTQVGSGTMNPDSPSIEEKLANADNDCPYKQYPLVVEGGDIQLSGDEIADASKIMTLIMSRGYSKAQAAGITGNIFKECSFKPNIVACDVNHFYSGGLCKWNAGALTALMKKDSYNVANGHYSGISCAGHPAFEKNYELGKQLPSLSEQVKFLLDALENDSVYKNWGIKNKLLATTTPEKAASSFMKNFERCHSDYCDEGNRRGFAKKFYDNYKTPVPPIEKNENKKVSDLANGFLHALNQTSHSSSVDVEIGIDVNKSNGDTIWLTNAKGSDRFSSVLDMILSAYSDKVSSVTWILPNSGVPSAIPVAYFVTVKEGSNSTKITAALENAPSNAIKIHIAKKQDNDETTKADISQGIHEDFCKALVKKYKSHTPQLESDTNKTIDDYDALFGELYNLQKCDDVKKELGINNEGGSTNLDGNVSSQVTNPLMKLVLSDVDHIDSGKLGKNFKISYNKYYGCCTSGPTTWYNRAKPGLLNANMWWYPQRVPTSTFEATKAYLNSKGFKCVWHNTKNEAIKQLIPDTLRAGDVCTIHVQGSSHGAMWTGKDWRSDAIQKGVWIYGSKEGRQGTYSVCIWRHPDFQEPGATVIEVA